MKVSLMFLLISKELFDNERQQHIRQKMFLKDFKIIDANSLYITGQCSLLDKEDIVFNDIDLDIKEDLYYIYDETGHNGEWSIREYDSLRKVEKFILSPGGYINMFCTHCIVFNKNKIFKFDIFSQDANGEKYIVDKDLAYDMKNLNIVWY